MTLRPQSFVSKIPKCLIFLFEISELADSLFHMVCYALPLTLQNNLHSIPALFNFHVQPGFHRPSPLPVMCQYRTLQGSLRRQLIYLITLVHICQHLFGNFLGALITKLTLVLLCSCSSIILTCQRCYVTLFLYKHCLHHYCHLDVCL